MKAILYSLIILLSLLFFNNSFSQEKPKELKLWYSEPADEWNEALPVGNGSLGAMVFGGITNERIQLNEESVWLGSKKDYHNPKSLEGLKEVRKLLFEGKYAQAEIVAQNKIMGEKNDYSTYQTLGNLNLFFPAPKQVHNYRRELDIENAVASVSYDADWVNYKREIFSSAPDNAIVMRFTSNGQNKISFKALLSRPENKADIGIEGNEITMREHVGDGNGVVLFSRVKALNDDGEIRSNGDTLIIENANEITLFITGATDYHGGDPEQTTSERLEKILVKKYDQIKKDHIADYKRYFDRVKFSIGESESVYFPTDARLIAMKNGNIDPHLIQLYYQYGRYLLISSSRPESMAANLQGIWAEGLYPPWSADYHININIQMNYWPAEITNLSELHMPFLQLLKDIVPDGQKTAEEVYGVKGSVAHYTTDAFHYTEPTGAIGYGMWPMGLAWSAQHLWEHYAFTEDKEYLDYFAYPIMKEAAIFCMDWLVEDPETGKLVSGPSISPENKFITESGDTASMVMGPTMDHMIIWDLLTNTIQASAILDTDKSIRKRMERTLQNLSPIQVGSDGRLMEWTEEFKEENPGHRHISHLFGLHPGHQITHQHNPELLEAARKTIEYRLAHGGGHTGWSRAWIINFYARLWDGEKAYENLLALLRKSTLPNLFDTHPPFQIDGNFGAVAGITEMLLQSHAGEVHVLPSLPEAWQQGMIQGIVARGGFEVDIDWKDGQLKEVKILSKLGNPCHLRYGDKAIEFDTEKGGEYRFDRELNEI